MVIGNILRSGIGGLLRRIGSRGLRYARFGGSVSKPLRSAFTSPKTLGRSFLRKVGNSRIGVKTRSAAVSLKNRSREAIKGAWRKIQVDPFGTAVAAVSTARTPTLRLDFGEGNTARIQNYTNLPNFGAW